jgi:Protein of unknown function (DUF1838)
MAAMRVLTEQNAARKLSALLRSVAVACLAGCAVSIPQAQALDLSTYEGQMTAYQKLRGNTNGSDTIADWQVTMFIVEPGKKAVPVMRLDGFNVGRFAKQPDGSVQWMSREVAYYRDLKTGKILGEWDNPVTGQKNQVVQVINDPVNSAFPAQPAPNQPPLPWNVRGDDVFLKLDIPLAYPNALLPADYPDESTGPTYLASEHFLFFAKTRDLMDPKLTSIPAAYAWTRTGPWLPWMKMGTRPGYVLYSGQGKKLASAEELDPVVREYTQKNHAAFMTAPKSFVRPNETSWTYYKKQFPRNTTSTATPSTAPTEKK